MKSCAGSRNYIIITCNGAFIGAERNEMRQWNSLFETKSNEIVKDVYGEAEGLKFCRESEARDYEKEMASGKSFGRRALPWLILITVMIGSCFFLPGLAIVLAVILFGMVIFKIFE